MPNKLRKAMWNDRFAEPEFAYGKEPNDFLASVSFDSPAGQVLCLAEGQGRNAVYLAGLGFEVTAVDLSEVGLKRTQELAQERNVSVNTICADLGTFLIPPASADGIVMIFGHTPPPVRTHIHAEIVKGLKPGGFLLMEGYRKEQLQFKTGGPPVESLLFSLDEFMDDFGAFFEWQIAREMDREVIEGPYHTGMAAVVQIFGYRKQRNKDSSRPIARRSETVH